MKLAPAVMVNGVRTESVPADDRGLHYGDGVWESMAVCDGKVLCLDQHLQRLRRGSEALGISRDKLPGVRLEARKLAKGAKRAVIKVILTRGSDCRGYKPGAGDNSRSIVTLQAWPQRPASWNRAGITLTMASTRLPLQPALAGFKHLNCLPQILARGEWRNPAIAEGLMRDPDGYIIEGTMSNLFMRRGDNWITPKLDRCGVRGIVRTAVIKLAAEEGVTIRQLRINRRTLRAADEMFMTNSVIGIWPVRKLLLGPRQAISLKPGAYAKAMRRRLISAGVIASP